MQFFYLKAGFGAFRPFVSGSFRPTAGFITPSAAYGLLLNIAGVEMRYDDGKSVMTMIKNDLPAIKIAVAEIKAPKRHVVLQQLHNYPIGTTGKEYAPQTKGSKYNIIPVKRELLSGIEAYICIECSEELENAISDGLSGKTERMYGLPFLGDNNFLIDRFEAVSQPEPAFWYEMIGDEDDETREHITRMTTRIDRADLSKTQSVLFASAREKTAVPPQNAWVDMP